MHPNPLHPSLQWDIFCHVIDNFGDIGVCWRLAVNLAQRGQTVRLWVDDTTALAWMAPDPVPGVAVQPWHNAIHWRDVTPGDVMVETFGCDIDPEFIAVYADYISARSLKSQWINLEYLTAEGFAARCHGLPSPVMSGPGKGLSKHFFYPGFTPDTGGLLREPDLLARQADFDRAHWLTQQHIAWHGERLVSLFCYEPAGLEPLLNTLANDAEPTLLLVTAGRAAQAVQQTIQKKITRQPNWNKHSQLSIFYLPCLTQTEFDHLLWACDLNCVRGEDSLVRALWAGKPLVWQIYPQHDDAHHAKLAAFLDWLQAPSSLRAFHQVWNGINSSLAADGSAPSLPLAQLPSWQVSILQARQGLLTQDDLVSSLLRFVGKNH